jgi:hypothetical protein
VKVVLRLLI